MISDAIIKNERVIKINRTEKTEEKFRELFGGKPVQNEGSDPEFMRILQRFIFGEVCYEGVLDNRMRELITVTVLTVNQTLPQLSAHVGACLNIGISPSDIRETVYQCAPFIGFPKTLNAISVMNEVFEKNGISLPLENREVSNENNRYEKGFALQSGIYGEEISDRYKWLPGEYGKLIPMWLTELCFGDFMSRSGLEAKTRELLTVVMLAAMGGTELQLRSHVIGALKTGSTREEIICALAQAMPYMGFPRLFNALNCSEDILNERDSNKIKSEFEKQNVFGKGTENTDYAKFFVGKSYLNPLTSPTYKPFFANVTFEPGCRNNWHIHKSDKGGGQILFCVAGHGWYQEWGKPAKSLNPGDVVEIPAGVRHWHGASKDSWFSHISVELPGENTSNEWLEAVPDEEYEKLSQEGNN